IPIAATTRRVVSVVSPRMESPSRLIAPEPTKRMPVTICAATRAGSARTTLPPSARNAWKPYAEMIVKSEAPRETSRWVRTPASRSRISRSRPIAPPRPHARASRSRASHPPSAGMLVTTCVDGLLLERGEVLDPARREVEQLVQASPVERHALGRGLHLDEPAVARHDDVDVHLGARVLAVVEIEQRDVVDHADRDRGHGSDERLREPEPVERALRRHVGAGDRGAARPAVGLQDVAVEVDGALAERLEVDDAAERAADQPLDLDRPPALPPARRLAICALAGRRRQERVLRGHPPAPRAVEPPRDAVLDRRRAEDTRLSLRPEHHPVRLLEERRVGDDRTQLVRPPPVRPAHADIRSGAGNAGTFALCSPPSSLRLGSSSSARRTCSTAPSGSCRNRSPSERNSSGSPVVRKRYEPSRSPSFSKPFRASVSATSRAVSSAEKTRVTSRPNARWNTGRSSG